MCTLEDLSVEFSESLENSWKRNQPRNSTEQELLMSVSYDSMCVIWSCACSRSGMNGCAVTRAGNDIFLIWHQLDLVLRGCSTSEYLCSVRRLVLERYLAALSTGGATCPGVGRGDTSTHCHGHKQCARLYLNASIDIGNCACIGTIVA